MNESLTDEQLREWRDRYPEHPYAEQWSGRALIDELLALRAQNAELVVALKEIAREQSAKTATEAADRFQTIARAAVAALAAEPASGEENADWSKLPRDMYVVSVNQRDAVIYDATLCNVPMAIGPEVRYVRADLATEANKGMAAERDASRAQNAELVAALGMLVAIGRPGREQYLPGAAGAQAFNDAMVAYKKAKAALAAAGQPQGSGE